MSARITIRLDKHAKAALIRLAEIQGAHAPTLGGLLIQQALNGQIGRCTKCGNELNDCTWAYWVTDKLICRECLGEEATNEPT